MPPLELPTQQWLFLNGPLCRHVPLVSEHLGSLGLLARLVSMVTHWAAPRQAVLFKDPVHAEGLGETVLSIGG